MPKYRKCAILTLMPDEQATRLHYRKIGKVLFIILALNWTVALIKILYGLSTRAGSVTADGFHSLSDGTSNIIGLIGIHIACQPVDRDHPYGHKKFETLFSLGIAAILLLVSYGILNEGIKRLFHPVTPEVTAASFIIMCVTIAVNIGVMRYEFMMGKRLHSDILTADATHTRADIITSLSVIVTLVAVKCGFPLLDAIVTILIAFFIAWAGVEIVKESSQVLCDSAAIIDVERIADIVLRIKGVKACHKIRSRGRTDDIHVDLHVQVSPSMHIDNAHRVSYEIENEIKRHIPEVSDVLVHIEPIE